MDVHQQICTKIAEIGFTLCFSLGLIRREQQRRMCLSGMDSFPYFWRDEAWDTRTMIYYMFSIQSMGGSGELVRRRALEVRIV